MQNAIRLPVNMRDAISAMIDKLGKAGKQAKMILSMNALTDEKLIKKLYKAAASGVDIQMLIRSIFCAESSQEKLVKPIRAISIVDRYLEHSRIWLFHHGGEEDIYISSADWMIRNLDYRIEVAVPIMDEAIKDELKHILKIKLSDTVKARWLDPELSNQYVTAAGKKKVRSQQAIYHYLKNKRYSHENSRH